MQVPALLTEQPGPKPLLNPPPSSPDLWCEGQRSAFPASGGGVLPSAAPGEGREQLGSVVRRSVGAGQVWPVGVQSETVYRMAYFTLGHFTGLG